MCFALTAVNLSTNTNPPAVFVLFSCCKCNYSQSSLHETSLLVCNNHTNITARVMSSIQ